MTKVEELVELGTNSIGFLSEFSDEEQKEVYMYIYNSGNHIDLKIDNMRQLEDKMINLVPNIEKRIGDIVIKTNLLEPLTVLGNFIIENETKKTTLISMMSDSLLSDGTTIGSFVINWNDGTEEQVVQYENRNNVEHTFPIAKVTGTQIIIEIQAFDTRGNASRIKEVVLTYKDNIKPAGDIVGNLGGYLEPGTWVGTYSGATDEDGTIQSYKVQNISTEYLTVQEAIVNAGTDHIFDLEEFDGDNIEVTYEVVAIDDKDAESSPELFTITCSGLLNANSDKFIYDEDSYNLLDSSLSTITQEADQEDFRKIRTTLYNTDGVDFGENKINDDLLLELEQVLEPEQTVVEIISGKYCTFVLLNDGTVKATGKNTDGQLGIGNNISQFSWVTSNISNVKSIHLSGYHSVALLNDGTVKACGGNEYGQLGIGNNIAKNGWTDTNLTDVKDINTNWYCTVALLNDGTVKACGGNNYGQLGIGNTVDQYDWVTTLTGAKSIHCHGSSSYIIMENDDLKVCGYNYKGKLGIGNATNQEDWQDSISNVSTVFESSSSNATFIILTDGVVRACGNGGQGQLGIGNEDDQFSWVDANITNVKKIINDYHSSIALLNDGTVKSCGYNGHGQQGNGGANSNASVLSWETSSPSDVKEIYSCYYSFMVLLNDGRIKVCGGNQYGQLGVGNTDNQLSWITSNISNVKKFSNGDYNSFAILNDVTVKSVGKNSWANLGIGNTIQKNDWVDTLKDKITRSKQEVSQIAIGYAKNIALLNDGTVKSVGDYYWQSQNISNVIKVFAGDYNGFAILNDGTLKCYGRNAYGQLGVGNTTDQSSWATIDISSLFSTNDIKDIQGATYHTTILLNDGTVYMTGRNYRGNLGIGNNTDQSSFVASNISDVKDITLSYEATVVLLNDGTVKSVGYNLYGKLGIGNEDDQNDWVDTGLSNVVGISMFNANTGAVLSDGTLKMTGYNNKGQIGNGNTTNQSSFVTSDISDVKEVAVGNEFVSALLNDGSIKAVGENSANQLGDNTRNDSLSWVNSTPLPNAKHIFCNTSTMSVQLEDNSFRFMGKGNVFGTIIDYPDGVWGEIGFSINYAGYKINTKEMVLPTGTREVTLTSTASLTKAEVSLWTI